MNTRKSTAGVDPKVKLSLLWIFVLLNMAYADILSLMDSTSLIREKMAGAPLPAGGLMAGALFMETAIAMVILPWVLNYKVNRWVNIVIGALNILGVVTGDTVRTMCFLQRWKWRAYCSLSGLPGNGLTPKGSPAVKWLVT
jgi:hypothetical protein